MTFKPFQVNGWTIAPGATGIYAISHSALYSESTLDAAVSFAQNVTPQTLVTGSPEAIDGQLRKMLSDEELLAFYQWVGAHAVREAIEDVKHDVGEDPVPVEHRHYTQDSVYEYLDAVHPDNEDYDPFPSKLPHAQPYCDVPHHAHPDGKGRMPSCRLDSPE